MKQRDIVGLFATSAIGLGGGALITVTQIPLTSIYHSPLLVLGGALLIVGLTVLIWLFFTAEREVKEKKSKAVQSPVRAPKRMEILELCRAAGLDVTARDTPSQNTVYDFSLALTQACVDGEIEVFGRKVISEADALTAPSNRVLVRVPAAHLQDDIIQVFARTNIATKTTLLKPKAPFYSDLHVNRRQAMAWLSDLPNRQA